MKTLPTTQHEYLEKKYINPINFRQSEGGHMSYHRYLFDDNAGNTYFAKAHDAIFFDEEWREKEMHGFLEKEYRLYCHLSENKYTHIPKYVDYAENILVLQGLTKTNGWYWRAPKDKLNYGKYAEDVLTALKELEPIPCHTRNSIDEVAIDVFYNNGWDILHELDIQKLISSGISKWSDSFHPDTTTSAKKMLNLVDTLIVKRHQINSSVLNHHDARQANIAWHPNFGTAVVDWSWADKGLPDGDTTMFLLDLHKAGKDIKPYMDLINPIYAKMIIGYWLQRSQTKHTEGNQAVRMQQFLSAIKASELVLKIL